MEAALNPILEAGMDLICRKSTLMTEFMIDLTDEGLTPLGFTLGTPRIPERRGSHVSLRHSEGYRINRALIEDMNVPPISVNRTTSVSALRRCIPPSRKSGRPWSASGS